MASREREEALQYLTTHSIKSVFEAMTTALLMERPEDPLQTLAEQLAILTQTTQPLSPERKTLSTSHTTYFATPQPSPPPSPPPSQPRPQPSPLDVGVRKSANGKRYMEDDVLALVSSDSHTFPFSRLLGVFDGHSGDKKAGRAAAEVAKLLMVGEVVKGLYGESKRKEVEIDSPRMFTAVFDAVQRGMTKRLKRAVEFAGTTASVSLLLPDNTLLSANVGDSSGFLVSYLVSGSTQYGATVVPLTTSHLASDPDEQQRAVDAGAFLTDDDRFGLRINGLQVTRSLGDVGSPGTVATPSTHTIALFDLQAVDLQDVMDRILSSSSSSPSSPSSPISLVHFIVLGSDGVWDVVSIQHLVDDLLDPQLSADANAESILSAVPSPGDNLSIVISSHRKDLHPPS